MCVIFTFAKKYFTQIVSVFFAIISCPFVEINQTKWMKMEKKWKFSMFLPIWYLHIPLISLISSSLFIISLKVCNPTTSFFNVSSENINNKETQIYCGRIKIDLWDTEKEIMNRKLIYQGSSIHLFQQFPISQTIMKRQQPHSESELWSLIIQTNHFLV